MWGTRLEFSCVGSRTSSWENKWIRFLSVSLFLGCLALEVVIIRETDTTLPFMEPTVFIMELTV